MTAWLGFYVAVLTIRVEYWAGIKYEKKLNLFFFLIGIGVVIYIVAAVLQYGQAKLTPGPEICY